MVVAAIIASVLRVVVPCFSVFNSSSAASLASFFV